MTLLDKLRNPFRRGRPGEQADRPSHVAPNDRIYAVGDIHGRADLLQNLLELIESDAETYGQNKNKRIICVGDYIDRGLDSKAVIDILLSRPLAGFDHIFLKGNHEDMLLGCLEDAGILRPWISVGGGATLLSYGVSENNENEEAMRNELLERIPPRHLDFLENLQLTFRSGDYLFVHAGIRPRVPLDQQSPRDLMWIRGEFLRYKGSLGVVVVHGHSISLKPEFLPERIGIDTGAYATNALSCVVLDGTTRGFLSTGAIEAADVVH